MGMSKQMNTPTHPKHHTAHQQRFHRQVVTGSVQQQPPVPEPRPIPDNRGVDEVERGGMVLVVTGEHALGVGHHRGSVGTAVWVAWHAAAC